MKIRRHDTPPEKIGPYRIEQRLGAGGMGTVYRAYDERLTRRVALKRIHPERTETPEARNRFLREARVVARLNHPALVHLHDFLETEDGDWLVMELAEGPTLARLLEAGPFDAGRALALAREVAGGLAAAHAEGIVHRDLKAENVVVTRTGRAKLLDFGLSKTLVPEEDESTLTGDGRLLGTPRAMSPEQARGRGVDPRSDLFSLGVLLYEMLTGRSPFLGPGPAETLARVCHHEQDSVRDHAPDVPRKLSDLVDRLLEKEPSARPWSADEVALELERIAEEDAPEPPVPPEPLPASPREPGDAAASGSGPFHLRGERRQLTVLACELTGAVLDPEVLFEVLPSFQSLASGAIERYGGQLRDVQGHRFVACFGYPNSYEDNTRRAVLAALEIVRGMEGELAARVGIHTGPAVVLTRDSGEQMALGHTLDLATWLQEQAEPGGVLVSAAARRLVEGLFEEERVGTARLPGMAEPPEAFRVISACEVHSRVESRLDLTPFVGRKHELGLLAGRFELAREATGQTILLAGEAGVGKTRLLRVFRERIGGMGSPGGPPRWITAYGSPFARNLPLYPVAGLLRQLLEIPSEAPAEDQLARLEKALEEYDFSPAETLPLFAVLTGLPAGGREAPRLAELRQETLEALPALVLEMAESRPLVLAFEELHHMDPTTLELVGRLVGEAFSSALLLLLTCRSGFRPPWAHRAQLTRLELGPLAAEAAEEMIDTLVEVPATGNEIPREVRNQIAARARGIPLFVEELAREALTSGGDSEGCEAVPASLRDLLAARLDRTGAARDVARICAMWEGETPVETLVSLSGLEPSALSHELERLLKAEILLCRETGYVFKHPLVRTLASESLLMEDRKALLRRKAALEDVSSRGG